MHAKRIYESSELGLAYTLSKKLLLSALKEPFTAREIVRPQWSGLTDKKHIVGLDLINNFDLINNSTGERVTQIEDNHTTVPALTIVENGDVNQSGSFNDDYTILIDIM